MRTQFIWQGYAGFLKQHSTKNFNPTGNGAYSRQLVLQKEKKKRLDTFPESMLQIKPLLVHSCCRLSHLVLVSWHSGGLIWRWVASCRTQSSLNWEQTNPRRKGASKSVLGELTLLKSQKHQQVRVYKPLQANDSTFLSHCSFKELTGCLHVLSTPVSAGELHLPCVFAL